MAKTQEIIMTNKEIIEVVKAHSQGKIIQFRDKNVNTVWTTCANNDPSWDFSRTDFRAKPEKCIRAYKDRDECWNDMLKHEPFGWVKRNDEIFCVLSVNEGCIEGSGFFIGFDRAINKEDMVYYIDGSPFGIVEKE